MTGAASPAPPRPAFRAAREASAVAGRLAGANRDER